MEVSTSINFLHNEFFHKNAYGNSKSKSINLHVIIQIITILLWNILGAAGIAVGFPLDTVKVRIQTQDPAKGLKYTSTFQCMRSIIKEEGVCTLLPTYLLMFAFWNDRLFSTLKDI